MSSIPVINFDFTSIEANVEDSPGHYFGTSPEALYTDREDYLNIFKALPPSKLWVELGSGVGLGPLLFALEHPMAKAIGLEFDRSRHDAAVKMKYEMSLANLEFQHADLMTCSIPLGDVYFLYFPTGPVLDRILCELGSRSHDFFLVVIESHGDLLPRLEMETWLELKTEVILQSKRHYPKARVYRNISKRCVLFNDLSFIERYLLIQEDDGRLWLGDSLGMEWQGGEHFLLQHPPRSFFSSRVQKVIFHAELSREEALLVELRKGGAVTIHTHDTIIFGELRKIMIRPSFGVEISSGPLIEWSQIKQIFQRDTLCYDSSSSLIS